VLPQLPFSVSVDFGDDDQWVAAQDGLEMPRALLAYGGLAYDFQFVNSLM